MFDQIKDATYRQKMKILVPHHKEMLQSIKKDLKQEHLNHDKLAHKKHFGNRPLHRITSEDLFAVYIPLMLESEECGEFVASRWIVKHLEIYEFFSRKLESLNKNFDQLTQLEPDFSHQITKEAMEEFGARATLIFCVLNSVIISADDYQILDTNAEEKSPSKEPISQSLSEVQSRSLEQRYQRKFDGLERKWQSEVKALKQQVAQLSRQLAVKTSEKG